MTVLLVIFLGIIGAINFRIRGGLLEDTGLPGTLSRASWGLSCLFAVWAANLDFLLALIVGLLCFVSTTDGLHNTIDMGKNIDTPAEQTQSVLRRFLRDFVVGHWHGLVLGAAAAAPLVYVNFGGPYLEPHDLPLWYLPLIAGALWAPIYAGATWLVPDWSILHRTRIFGIALGKGGNAPEAAEFLFGFEFIVFLYYASVP